MTPQWAAWLATAGDELRAEIAEIMEKPPAVERRGTRLLEIADAINRVLREADGPMTSGEIKARIDPRFAASLGPVLSIYFREMRSGSPGRFWYTAPL